MPTFTYPGVYIEELSSGVHSITGVATSIAAFIGWAPQGPVTEATLIESWADYEASFGGLDARSYLGYAVQQFFANGGTQAYIVRLVWDGSLPAAPGTNPAPSATAVATGAGYATAAISASFGAIASPSVPVSIGASVLQSLSIGPAGLPAIPLGATVPLVATGSSSNGTSAALATATWISSNPGVLAVNVNTGSATAMSAGTAIVTATSGLVSGSISLTVANSALSTITITPATPTLAAGAPPPAAGQPWIGPQQQLTALGNYLDGTSLDLTHVVAWSSSDTAMAFVDPASGLVTASSTVGAPTITASWLGVSATDVVTVVAKAITGITVHPGAPVAKIAETVNFTALGTFSDQTTGALPAAEVWSSANPAVVTIVAATGVATAVAPGSTTITVTSGGLTASATLTVTAASLNAISITPINPSVAVDLTLPLKATGIYSDGTSADLTSTVDWTSAGPDASIDPETGIVKGATVDAAVAITAAWQGVNGTTNVAVTAPVLQSIAITPASVSLLSSGQTAQLKATGTFSDGSTSDLTTTSTWVSSAPPVATVSGTGLATAIASGGSLTLFAANPGAWGNNLRVGVLPQTSDPTRFGILVQQVTLTGQLQTLESFVNLSTTTTDPLYAVTVIDNDSNYVSFINPATGNPVIPTAAPSPTPPLSPVPLNGGADGAVLVPASDQNFEIALTFNATAGVFLLDRVDIFNLLCIPGETDAPTISTLQQYCASQRAFYIVDAPQLSTVANLTQTGPVGSTPGPITGTYANNSAYYFPWVQAPDPLVGNRPSLYPPCGFVAGIYAATDANRGVWKAPAGIQASLTGVSGLQYNLTDLENGDLNIQAINCLRQFKTYGDVVWGARTLQGNDQTGSEWKYIPIRRLALYIESSLYEGTQWVVFEPNDVPLWGQIRLNVGAFMQGLFLQGAFQGTSPQQAYFVKCDAENNPQASIDLGVVNILVGFAPLYPAEFVVIQIQQIAGQVA
ncbi:MULTISPECIES: Ig-like domain-containing protein [Acidobacteriaceae]|uniref:Ig-like domain-containing protein n=1 Tax=Acidobacteriaceae TaxID=204434 RepID=UPI001C205E36|nr:MULTISPECIES: Ig-like domain-containing protein [Acidobacteriaceae]MDW5265467.1 Ig-like domain-containing protein [Edaphobacter sp.]